ncbi:MAG: cation-efflux pump [Pirellulales bacterium]|nr:cation-efflux pump [Pirellulales bacterium]
MSDFQPKIHAEIAHADREKRGVAFWSLMAAVLLTTIKVVVGIWTNSLGILAEAAHSALDLIAAAMTLWAVRMSSLPADREHSYGHGKFENLSALFETLLLLVTCAWIIYESANRLFFQAAVEVKPRVWAFLVIVISVAVDFSRSRALKKAADKYNSQALEADALHFSTDIWSSLVVFFGLICVLIGQKFEVDWLENADSVAALCVAGIVVWVSFQLGKKSIDDLLDSVPKGWHEKVEDAVKQVAGLGEIRKLRLRRAGPEVFADVTVAVERAAAFEKVHDLSDAVEAAVRGVLPEADVVVHVEPVATDAEDVTTKVRLLAARRELGAHGIRIYEERGQRWLELHLEVSESLTLDEAHRKASEFERALREALPGLERIVTHLEPAGDSTSTIRAEPVGENGIRQVLEQFRLDHRMVFDPHDLHVQQIGDELSVSLHCTLAPATSIADAHDFTVRLEDYLRSRVKRLGRVVIHVEPQE